MKRRSAPPYRPYGSGRTLRFLRLVYEQDHDVTGPAAVIGQTEAEAGEAGTLLSPAYDDLALRAAFYGLVIQSYADKVFFAVLLPQIKPKRTTYQFRKKNTR